MTQLALIRQGGLLEDIDEALCESDPRQRKLNFDKVETTEEPAAEAERFKKVN